jgi:hypothetical protein
MPLNTYLEPFFQETDDFITITPQQASTYAKEVAGDFNPLHNPGAKRFVVPGDLLFALVLARNGLSQEMEFNYTGMVGNGVLLKFPKQPGEVFGIVNDQGKQYLEVSRNGENSTDMQLIEAFTRAYVAFSGHSFPHILVPLMKENQVMINPDRPMVIYENMYFTFDRLDITLPTLELINSSLDVHGKRGTVRLNFQVLENGEQVGSGYKTLVLSGLREYDEAKVQGLVDDYELIKADYKAP